MRWLQQNEQKKNKRFHMFMSTNPKSTIIFSHLWDINANIRTYVRQTRWTYAPDVDTFVVAVIMEEIFVTSDIFIIPK